MTRDCEYPVPRRTSLGIPPSHLLSLLHNSRLKLASLATEKFIADLVRDAQERAELRCRDQVSAKNDAESTVVIGIEVRRVVPTKPSI